MRFFIVNIAMGSVNIAVFSVLYFLTMLSFAIDDYFVFKPEDVVINILDTGG